MSDWPLYSGSRHTTYGAATAASSGTQIAYTVANTKSGWNQVTASSAHDAHEIVLYAYGETSACDMLVDIGVGGAGSEQVVLPNLAITSRDTTAAMPSVIKMPCFIPAGSRISIRFQNSVGVSTMRYVLTIVQLGGLWPPTFQRITAYGVNVADSGSVSVDPGASINTKGSYSEIEDATANPIRLLWIAFGLQANTARTDYTWLVDIAVGGAGSEQIIIPDQWIAVSASRDTVVQQFIGPFEVSIPEGSRLAVRMQCSGNDAADRLLDVALYGAD
jgi:hypothetical protein